MGLETAKVSLTVINGLSFIVQLTMQCMMMCLFSQGQVSTGDTPGSEVNVSGTRGSFFSTGLTGTDSGFGNDFAFGGSESLPALIYLNLFYN